MCQIGNCPFSNLKSKVYKLIVVKTMQRLKQKRQKSPAGTRQPDGKNLVWFGKIESKLAKFFLLIVLCFMGSTNHSLIFLTLFLTSW
jgi:hypothetical protein